MKKETEGMKKILCAAAAAVAVAGTACAARVKAPAGVVNVEAISKYVYPGNAVSTPGAMQYMPDGETFLRLSADGSKIVKYDTATGKETETVLDVTHTRENTIAQVESFTISADGTDLLRADTVELVVGSMLDVPADLSYVPVYSFQPMLSSA